GLVFHRSARFTDKLVYRRHNYVVPLSRWLDETTDSIRPDRAISRSPQTGVPRRGDVTQSMLATPLNRSAGRVTRESCRSNGNRLTFNARPDGPTRPHAPPGAARSGFGFTSCRSF